MKISVTGAVAALLACATLILPGTAQALSCATNLFHAPEDGATGVPTNALLWGYGQFEAKPPGRLFGPDGEVPLDERSFPLVVSSGWGTDLPVLVPRAELQPNTTYLFLMNGASVEDDGSGYPFRITFTTGSGPVSTPPPVPQLVSVEASASSDVTPNGYRTVSRSLKLQFDQNAGILIGDGGNSLGAVTSAADLLLPTPSASGHELAPNARAVHWATTNDALAVGVSLCMVWPDAAEDQQQARFGVLDLAGNFSGWAATTQLLLPSREEAEASTTVLPDPPVVIVPAPEQSTGTGCALSPPRSGAARSSWAVLALAAGLAYARQRSTGARPRPISASSATSG